MTMRIRSAEESLAFRRISLWLHVMSHHAINVSTAVILITGLIYSNEVLSNETADITSAVKTSSHNTSGSAKPNVIIVLVDDLGYGDISCNGARTITTPHIDSIASSGVRFTSGYSSASTCTPTRYSLLTGTYAFRVKGTGIAPPNSPALIQPGTHTLATMLKEAKYRTAVVGKWHLGLGGKQGPEWNERISAGPNEIGFDYSFILPTTNDRVPQVYVRNGSVVNLDSSDPIWVGDKKPASDHPTGESHRHLLKMDWSHGHNQTIHNGVGRIGFYTGGRQARFRDEDLADAWAEECSKWIEAEDSSPFFLLFCPHNIHVPRVVHERFQGKSGMGPRGDAILELDWTIGELLQSLDKAGKRDDTLIIFCSDNGPVLDDGYVDEAIEKLGEHRPAGPFKGGKYNVFEAGTRTPFIASWPNQIPKGIVSDNMVSTIDFSASLATLVGIDLPEGRFRDSVDVLDALLAKPNAKGRANLVIQDNGSAGNFGYREGKWKLINYRSKNARNVELRLVNTPVNSLMLFDLEADPGETRDVSGEFPDVTKRMHEALMKIVNEPAR